MSIMTMGLMLLAPFLGGSAASAQTSRFADGNDRTHRLDIRRVTVNNGTSRPNWVVVGYGVDNLLRGDAIRLTISTGTKRGQSYRVVDKAGSPPNFWQQNPRDGRWIRTGCSNLRVGVNMRTDRIAVSLPRPCLDLASRVRINLSMSDRSASGRRIVDTFPRGSRLSSWVSPG